MRKFFLNENWAAVLLISFLDLFIFSFGEPNLFKNPGSIIYNNYNIYQPFEEAGLSPDPLQMFYLTWHAGESFHNDASFTKDIYQFANNKDKFKPRVTDPLVYLGGYLSKFFSLTFSYNLAQVYLPLLGISIISFFMFRLLGVPWFVAIAGGVLMTFVPERKFLNVRAQHIAASVVFVTFYFWAATMFFKQTYPRWKVSLLVALALVLIGISEEHLSYYSILFGLAFVMVYLVVEGLDWQKAELSIGPLAKRYLVDLWPIVLALAFIGWHAWVLKNFVENLSRNKRNYNYSLIESKYITIVDFIGGPYAMNYGLWALIVIGAGFCAVRIARSSRTSRDWTVLAFLLIFVSSFILSLGHQPFFDSVFGFQPYRFFFENFPLFNKQRFPFRMAQFTYFTGIMLAVFGAHYIWSYPSRIKLWQPAWEGIFAIGFLTSAFLWATVAHPEINYLDPEVDPIPKIHALIIKSTNADDIILQVPQKGQSRVLEHIMFTKRRFFNGYWWFSTETHRRSIPLLRALEMEKFTNRQVAKFNRLGIDYLLVDKRFLKDKSLFKNDDYKQLNYVETVWEEYPYLFLRFKRS